MSYYLNGVQGENELLVLYRQKYCWPFKGGNVPFTIQNWEFIFGNPM